MQREEFAIETSSRVERNGTQIVASNNAENDHGWSRKLIVPQPCSVLRHQVFVGILIAIVLGIIFICVAFMIAFENEEQLVATVDLHSVKLPPAQAVWFRSNLDELYNAVRVPRNARRARNVVLFVALNQTRHGPSELDYRPVWESFPHLALLRASQGQREPFDPTAIFCGIETQPQTLGLDSSVQGPWNVCIEGGGSINETQRASSIVDWAQAVGRRTGVVTNGEIVHAFPASLYAHTPNTDWTYASPDSKRCETIQSQLSGGATGRQLNVIAGSMQRCPGAGECQRTFERRWENQKQDEGEEYRMCSDSIADLLTVEVVPKYALALYHQQTLAAKGSFHDLTVGAVRMLDSSEGFLLIAIVDPSVAISLTELDSTVQDTLRKLSDSRDDSLVVVMTASPGDRWAAVHATGPMANLLHRVHNQTYVAHFVSYAARIGRFRDTALANFVLEIF
ncbi:membrane-bound alkaline phosphatase-like [Anopheles bellator]|uniref:membrane-bound alkaline phosphatase-like n=1 Tax=Anopheles bellator TaxID=139047 RepID=UPI002647F3AD|nr:membrane-bound alkaline phosphatase-like [Anopheles bellator]